MIRSLLPIVAVALLCSCTKQQAQSADTVAIDLTNAACQQLENQPAGQPWVDVVCMVAGGVEQGIATLTSSGTQVPSAIKTVTLHLPAAEVPAFLAAHPAKKS